MAERRTLARRGAALLLSAATLWAAGVTAGSESAAGAWRELRSAAPLWLLRRELGELSPAPGLSPAAALVIAQSPLLLAAAGAAEDAPPETEAAGAEGEAAPEPAGSEEREEREERAPETPLPSPDGTGDTAPEAPPLAEGVENGAIPRTLTPSPNREYLVCGDVYIYNSTAYAPTAGELTEPFSAALGEEGPQILILHSHGSEAYTPAEGESVVWSGDCRTTDSRYNVLRVGDVMADVFARHGLGVLHDRTLYDYPAYSGSYDRSLAGVEEHLRRYPSISLVLDLHRDAIRDGAGNEYKVLSDNGAAGVSSQLTLVVGSDGGGAAHPGWMDNLRFAVALQQQTLEDYPTLLRPMLLRNSRYNQHVSPGALLVEVGAAGNAPEEAALAAKLLAEEIVRLLKP